MTQIKKIEATKKLSKLLRVAAYARVSKSKETLAHSLNVQIEHYQSYIKANKNYIFKGVYADLGISGTKEDREEFNKLLEDCRKGEIDLILTKSISRFARNTATLLKVVRELKSLKVDVFFEEQNIHTNSEEGEFILTILASMAQEEARDMSENVKWSVLKRFNEGKLFSMTILGYRLKDGVLVIEPNEAEIVRQVFKRYLEGAGILTIVKELRASGYKSRLGKEFTISSVRTILKDEVYTGDLVLQKTYRENFMTRVPVKNNGQKRRWVVEEAHEPIISKELFNKVKEEMARRHDGCSENSVKPKEAAYPFSLMITCCNCGRHYIRGRNLVRHLWRCTTFSTYGKDSCSAKSIPEEVLFRLSNEVLGTAEFDEALFNKRVEQIVVQEDGSLLFKMKNGKEILKTWEYKSRSASWTPEMREAARMRNLARKERAVCQK